MFSGKLHPASYFLQYARMRSFSLDLKVLYLPHLHLVCLAGVFLIVCCLVWRCRQSPRRRVFTPIALLCPAAPAPAAAPPRLSGHSATTSRPAHLVIWRRGTSDPQRARCGCNSHFKHHSALRAGQPPGAGKCRARPAHRCARMCN